MRVIIAGSRSITSYDFVCKCIEESGFDVREVVSGTARGVDQLGERWAKDNGIPVIYFPADWSTGKGAGYRRNVDMAEYADALIACWDGVSKGTNHMVNIIQNMNKDWYIRKPNKWEREWK